MIRIRQRGGKKTYFVKWVPIGPMFGGTKQEAMTFASRNDAFLEMAGDWRFADCEIEEDAK